MSAQWLVMGITVISLGMATQALGKKAERPSELAILHNNRGVTELYQGNPQKALFEFQTATELDPNYVEAVANLGIAYKVLGQYGEARKAFERAIDLDHKYATPYNHLGTIYYSEGNYDKAISLFETAAHKNKKFADAWLNLGLATIALAKKNNGDVVILKKAIDPLRQATDIDTAYSRAHVELAQVYDKLGDYEKAIIRYKLALETDPNSVDAWIRLGTLYYQKEEVLQAKNCFVQAIQLAPQSVEAHLQLGAAYLKEGNMPLALTEFQTVLTLAPTHEVAYFHMGYTHFLLGNQQKEAGKPDLAAQKYRDAVSAYAQAVQLNPTFADAAYNAGYTESIAGNIDSAKTWYEKALAANRDYYRAAMALGLLAQDRGQTGEANTHLCRVLKEFSLKLSPEEKVMVKTITTGNGGCR